MVCGVVLQKSKRLYHVPEVSTASRHKGMGREKDRSGAQSGQERQEQKGSSGEREDKRKGRRGEREVREGEGRGISPPRSW